MPVVDEIGGTCYFKVDGAQYGLRGSCKINYGGAVRTPVMNADGTMAGYTTKYVASTIEVEVSDGPTISQAVIRAIVNETVTLELANGKTYIIPTGFITNDPDLDTIEGKFTVKFAGPGMTEVLGTS